MSKEELLKNAEELRKSQWEIQKKNKIDYIPSNDFSFYDGMLDTAYLLNVIPKEYYKDVNHIFIWHGRNICTSQSPKCDKCPLQKYCKSYNKTENHDLKIKKWSCCWSEGHKEVFKNTVRTDTAENQMAGKERPSRRAGRRKGRKDGSAERE